MSRVRMITALAALAAGALLSVPAEANAVTTAPAPSPFKPEWNSLCSKLPSPPTWCYPQNGGSPHMKKRRQHIMSPMHKPLPPVGCSSVYVYYDEYGNPHVICLT